MTQLNLDIDETEAADDATGAAHYTPPNNLAMSPSETPDGSTASAQYQGPMGISIAVTEAPDQASLAFGSLGGVDQIQGAATYRPLVQVQLLQPNLRTAGQPVGYTSGLGTLFDLTGAGFQGRFHEGVPHETGWVVTCLARPAEDLGEVLAALDDVGEDTMVELFGVAPQEPYRTWKALWYSEAPLPYRLGAVLLALAARTDELRKGGR